MPANNVASFSRNQELIERALLQQDLDYAVAEKLRKRWAKLEAHGLTIRDSVIHDLIQLKRDKML